MFGVSGRIRVGLFACLVVSWVASTSSPVQAQGFDRPVSWTGFYFGAHGAYMWTDIEHPLLPPAPAGPPVQELDGGLLGGQIGAQYQFGTGLVLGVEADISKGNLSTTVRDGNYITQTGTIELMGTVRGRVGYAFGAFMPYLTAGFMWDRVGQNQTCPDPAGVPFGHCRPAAGFAPYNITVTETNTGWVFGGGLDWKVAQHFSVRVEGLRFSMDDKEYQRGITPSGKDLGPTTIGHDGTMFRIGANYHF
jgi:outer membrane immunogenic protein